MVQSLGLGAFIAVAQVQFLVGELRSYKPHGKKRKTSLRASGKGIYICMVRASNGGINLVSDGKDSLRKCLVEV